MEEFEYLCVTLQGKYLRGELCVEDKDQLSTELWQHKLFLVWWKSIEISPKDGNPVSSSPTMPVPRLIDLKEARSIWDSHEGERNAAAARPSSSGWDLSWLVRPQVIIIVIALFLGTAIYDISYVARRHRHQIAVAYPMPSSDLTDKMKNISLGTTRQKVEKLFPQRAKERKTSSQTRYQATEDFEVEIGFDDTGGEWNLENKVNKTARLLYHGQALP